MIYRWRIRCVEVLIAGEREEGVFVAASSSVSLVRGDREDRETFRGSRRDKNEGFFKLNYRDGFFVRL